jgi:phage-related protein
MRSKKDVALKNVQPAAAALTTILSVIYPAFCPVDRVLTFVLSVVRTTVRSITDAVPAFFTKVLLVIDTIGGIFYGIMSSLDASADPGREDYWRCQSLPCILRDAR